MHFLLDMKNSRFAVVAVAFFTLLAGCAGINRQERKILVQHQVSPVVYDRMMQREILTLGDIIELSQRQVPPPLIIRYLYSTRAIYSLDKAGLARLNAAKVSREVLDYLLQTPDLFALRAYPAPYPYYEDGRPWYPYGAYYPYYPYPHIYGSSSVIITSGRCYRR